MENYEAATEDVQQHVSAFLRIRPTYEKFASYIENLVGAHCGKDLIHATEARAKSPQSFERKCQKMREDGAPAYDTPLAQITDLAGVRIIVFTRDAVDKICSSIRDNLDVIEFEDVGDRVYSQGKFGYQSKHLLVRLGNDRRDLIENKDFSNFVCEIQVRTILQHAWAEMEHDIQYKSDQEIPLDLKKRFSALAGLLELADREFQNIQQDSESLRRAVKSDLIDDLTQQSLTERRASSERLEEPEESVTAVRDLVSQGLYAEAVKNYSDKIEKNPSAYTLYIGRARAKFLAGDSMGAVSDLDRADELSKTLAFTARLRGIIEHGDDSAAALQPIERNAKITDGLQAAQTALAKGEGISAFEEYTNIEAEGYNKALVLFGKATCCTLEKDTSGAKNFLSTLRLFPATPMAVNITALNCIVDILDGRESEDLRSEMLSRLQDCPEYSLSASPLKSLFQGLRQKDYPEVEALKRIEENLIHRTL